MWISVIKPPLYKDYRTPLPSCSLLHLKRWGVGEPRRRGFPSNWRTTVNYRRNRDVTQGRYSLYYPNSSKSLFGYLHAKRRGYSHRVFCRGHIARRVPLQRRPLVSHRHRSVTVGTRSPTPIRLPTIVQSRCRAVAGATRYPPLGRLDLFRLDLFRLDSSRADFPTRLDSPVRHLVRLPATAGTDDIAGGAKLIRAGSRVETVPPGRVPVERRRTGRRSKIFVPTVRLVPLHHLESPSSA
jgi:hypothetical protein